MFHNITLEQLHQTGYLSKCKSQIKVTECGGHPVLQIVDGSYWIHLHNTGPDISTQDGIIMDELDVELFTRAYLPTN